MKKIVSLESEKIKRDVGEFCFTLRCSDKCRSKAFNVLVNRGEIKDENDNTVRQSWLSVECRKCKKIRNIYDLDGFYQTVIAENNK